MRLAAPALADALEPALAALALGEDPPEAVVVKRSRARSVLRLRLEDGSDAFLKWSRREGLRWRASDAAREYRSLSRARAAGIAAVEPLAVAERNVGLRRETVLATRAASGATVVAEALPGLDDAARRELLGAAAALARRLHEAGLWHRDLHVGNLLRSGSELLLVDLQKLVALPFPPPLALRARDLVWLVSDGRLGTAASPREIASAYAAAAPGGPALEPFIARLARAAARAARARLTSRERRCVLASTGFRIESRGAQRVLRRADVTTSAALQAAAAARGERAPLRIAAFTGGPPPGPAAEPFDRGQGAAEPGAPAGGAACVRGFSGGLGATEPLALAHPGLRAWRLAHALLLRGLDTPAPLALVETWRFGWVSRSVLVTRCADDAAPLAQGDAEQARAVGAALARLHARGAEVAGAALHWSAAARALVALAPEDARIHAELSPARAERDLERIVRPFAPAEREALLAAYREAARS